MNTNYITLTTIGSLEINNEYYINMKEPSTFITVVHV